MDQLLDHLGGAHDAILTSSHDDLARLALWEVLVHDDVCLAGLLQRSDGLTSTPNDPALGPEQVGSRGGGLWASVL